MRKRDYRPREDKRLARRVRQSSDGCGADLVLATGVRGPRARRPARRGRPRRAFGRAPALRLRVAADQDQHGDASDQDHGELAIGELAVATAAIVAEVIAAAGAEATYPTGRQRREKLR